MSGQYILDGHNPVRCDDLIQWGRWFETGDRKVARFEFPNGVVVSTVFLGLDHSFGGDTPILFQTMVFGGEHDQAQERYATWDEAEAGHLEMIERVKQ